MTTTTILVTGATGTIGSQVALALRDSKDVRVRAAARTAAAVKTFDGASNIEVIDFDYGNADSIAKAVRGVDRVFLATPFSVDQVDQAGRLIDASVAAGVTHIVKLSAIGCENEPGIQLGRWHRAIEKKVEASGIGWTFLRPNNFYENFIHYYGPDPQGNIYLPWGEAACSFIAGADIAQAAKVVLTEDGHANKAYPLTGPEAFTIAQAAAQLSSVTGRPIRYVDVPEAVAKKAMLDIHMPEWMVDAMMELHAIDKAGYASAVTNDLEILTGRKGTSFASFAKANQAKWT